MARYEFIKINDEEINYDDVIRTGSELFMKVYDRVLEEIACSDFFALDEIDFRELKNYLKDQLLDARNKGFNFEMVQKNSQLEIYADPEGEGIVKYIRLKRSFTKEANDRILEIVKEETHGYEDKEFYKIMHSVWMIKMSQGGYKEFCKEFKNRIEAKLTSSLMRELQIKLNEKVKEEFVEIEKIRDSINENLQDEAYMADYYDKIENYTKIIDKSFKTIKEYVDYELLKI